MLRFVSAGALLLTIASSVSAGERYIEIWNPPEARTGSFAGKSTAKTHHSTVAKRDATRLVPRRVADPLGRATASHRVPAPAAPVASKKPAAPPYIPRVITPEGNVLRV